MKRIVSFILAVFFVFMLCACSKKEEGFQEEAMLQLEQAESSEEVFIDEPEQPEEETAEKPMLFGMGNPSQAKLSDEENYEEADSELLGADYPALLSVRLTVTEDTKTVARDEKFNAALLSIGQKEFEEIGFRLGDSCSVSFGNGYTLADIPYYNGYYVRNGAPVIVAYPGDPYIRITLNNEGIWDTAGLENGMSATVTLNEAGKYLAVQEALGQQYSFKRSDYGSDEEFTNFRALTGGKLKPDFLYRGASPVDNSRGRAAYTDKLLEKKGIEFVIDLADSKEDMNSYILAGDYNSPYTKELYENGRDVLLDMSSAYSGDAYKKKVAEGLTAAISYDAPWYIHCMEGKDRTGFVCLLLEALAGANYNELLDDYMITYRNYFDVSATGTPEKYAAIENLYFVPFLEFLHGTDDLFVLKTADFAEDAKNYLRAGGMTDENIDALLNCITE